MTVLCVITARGGSKRIPRKNIREFCGRPIIAYGIEAALKSSIFDEVMVSTDDEEIAEVARALGAEVPFMRSARTSSDFATTADVLLEVLDEYESQGRMFDYVCCIYPTAPFVTAEEISAAFDQMRVTSAPAVVAVTSFDFPPQRAFSISADGTVEYLYPEYAFARSQDLPQTAHDCGRLNFSSVRSLRESKTLIPQGCIGFWISPTRVQDIDTLEDWDQAEFKYLWSLGKGTNDGE